MRRPPGSLTTPPWTRAPLLLRRSPGVALALVAATAVLGIAAASGSLFLSSAASATFARDAGEGCVERSRPAVANPAQADLALGFGDFYSTQRGPDLDASDRIVRAAMRQMGLPAPYRVMVHDAPLRPGADPVNPSVTLFSRPDALEHVEILQRADGRGVWLTDRYAGVLGLETGDTLRFAYGQARVVGIYRDLAGNGVATRLPEYWCSWSDLILPSLETRPAPLVLVDPQTLYALVPEVPERGDEAPEIFGTWYAPVDARRLGIAEVEALVVQAEPLTAEIRRQATALGLGNGSGYNRMDALPQLATSARAAEEVLRGPVLPVALAATVVALLLVVAAGGLWVAQRGREVELLVSRGVGAAPIGLKAGLEMLPAVAIGAAVGWLGAAGLIRLLGPSPLVDPGALGQAGRTVTTAAVGAVVALGVVAAAGSARRTEPAAGRRRWRWVPWEVVFLGAAWWAYAGASDRGGATAYGETVGLDPLLIAFPMFALLGSLLVAARVLGWLVPLGRRLSAGWRPAGWLAVRGLAGALGVVLSVFVLTAVPIGVLTYSAGLTDSLATSVSAKSGTYNGAEYAYDLRARAGVEPTPDLRGQGTFVNVVSRAEVDGRVVQLLGVEPDRFADFAAWNAAAVGAGPDELLERLRTPSPAGAPLPVLVVGEVDGPVTEVDLFRTLLPVEVVGTADSFPGLRAPTVPMLVADRALLGDADRYADREIEVWTDADHVEALVATLAAQDVQVDRQRTPDTFVTAVDLLPVTWAFAYLQVIAALTGLIAVAALLLYLAVRQRQRFAAYHLARRMGMRPAGHIRALAAEVALVLGSAWLAGVGLGLLCVGAVHGLLELNPTFPPPPLFAVPTGTLAWTAAATAVAVLAAALIGHAAARSTRAGDVLRIA